jgi:hypothetical protein
MIPTIMTALRTVSTPRFFETERGYQGELLAELRAALPALALPGDAIVEQEYQKTLPIHNINVPPQLVVPGSSERWRQGSVRVGAATLAARVRRRCAPHRAG